MSSLADRIRGVVSPGNRPAPDPSRAADGWRSGIGRERDLAALGGGWRDGCFVVDREWGASAAHGRTRVGELAAKLRDAVEHAPLFANGLPARTPLLFFDLETTGLNGGAGTHAFLVGCGWFDGDRFVTRQFVMTGFADERRMLETVAAEMGRAGALVSFNGKSFDAPLLETRYLFHRLPWSVGALPHIDVLHPARQFWKRDDCSLVALEHQVVGHRRVGDVPGFQIPARYFQFVRSGDAGPLAPVLQHNRLDLLSLAALTARLLTLARTGPEAAADAREALALGRVYARAGMDEGARGAFLRAIAVCGAPPRAFDAVKIDALRALAHTCRRLRRHDDAARCWQDLLSIRGCPAGVASEASEALAVHAEHRLKDFETARRFAAATIGPALTVRRSDAVQWRLSRLERKIAARPAASLLD